MPEADSHRQRRPCPTRQHNRFASNGRAGRHHHETKSRWRRAAALMLLAGAGAQAADEPLDARARRLLLCRRQDHAGRRPRISLRPDVRRDPHPGEADASLSDHHGAWRLDVRHQLHRHARRPRRLGAVFRPPGLRRLCGRPAGPRPLRIPHRRASGRCKTRARNNSASRFISQEKFKLWPQAALHTQWPGNGEADDPATLADSP